jgi:5-methylcytosine-specific restriction endonuclease McrA
MDAKQRHYAAVRKYDQAHPEMRRAISRRSNAKRRAIARDGRLNIEERAALKPIRQRHNFERWAERHRERLDYERAVRRDARLTPAETAAKRKIYHVQQRREWAERNPERQRQHAKAASVAYQARRRGAPGIASTDQVTARWAYYGDRCWMCREPATQTDHVIPLSRGGSNWPANLRPACGPCNREKWDRLPTES